MTPEEKNTRLIENYKKHCESTQQNIKYSHDRFEILILTLSSGGIVLVTSFMKDLIVAKENTNLNELKVSVTLFVITIILNLFSHVTSYYANKKDLQAVKNIIKEKEGKGMHPRQVEIEKHKEMLNSWTMRLNAACLFTLVIAMTLTTIFIFTKL